MASKLNEYEKEIEDGKKILREEGMNFTLFKTSMRRFFVHPEQIDEDSFVWFYICYAEYRAHYPKEKLRDWAAMHFQDFNKDENRFWLTNYMRKYI